MCNKCKAEKSAQRIYREMQYKFAIGKMAAILLVAKSLLICDKSDMQEMDAVKDFASLFYYN